jgi:hypothetical protein
MADVPKGLGSLLGLIKRFGVAKKNRELWRSLFQECYDYAIPDKETFNFRSPGQRKNRQVYDSTAVNGVERFSSRLQASLTPPWTQWMDLVAGSDIPKNERDKISELLEQTTDIFFAHLNQSDFANQDNEANQDLSIGTGALMFEEGDESKGQPLFKFTSIPLSELYLEPVTGGRPGTFWRQHEVEARQLPQLWPEGDFGQKLSDMIAKKPDTKVTIIDGTVQDGQVFHQVVIHEASKQLIFTQEYTTNPGIIFRWSVAPNETYGRGPIVKLLPDIRTLNKVVEFELKAAALAISGIYTAVDDGVFNPYTARLVPNTIMPVASNASTNPSLSRLDSGSDVNFAQLIIGDLRENINDALFVNPLGDLSDPVRTATESIIRNQEMLKNAGASFGRLKSEKIEPIVARGMEILIKNGKVAPIRVDGREVAIKMASPLAKAEAQEDFSNYQVWRADMATLPPEVQLASVKLEEIPGWTARQLGVPAELVRDKDTTKQLMKEFRQAAQQQAAGGDLGSEGGA